MQCVKAGHLVIGSELWAPSGHIKNTAWPKSFRLHLHQIGLAKILCLSVLTPTGHSELHNSVPHGGFCYAGFLDQIEQIVRIGVNAVIQFITMYMFFLLSLNKQKHWIVIKH